MPPEEFPSYTMDDLADLRPDGAQQADSRKSLQLPRGLYNSIPKVTSRLTVVEKAGPQLGRKIVRFTAKVRGAVSQRPENQDAVGKEGMAFFGASWQQFKKEDGRVDISTKLYLDAQDLWNDSHGMPRTNIPTVKEVMEFIETYPIGLVLGQGDSNNIVLGITAPKE